MTSITTCKLKLQFNKHTDRVTSIKICKRDETPVLYTASRDRSVRGWVIEKDKTGEETARLQRHYVGHGGMVTAFEISPDGEYIISIGTDGMIRRWPANGKSDEQEIRKEHNGTPYCVYVGGGEAQQYILTGGKSPALYKWNTQLELMDTLLRTDDAFSGITLIRKIPKKQDTVLCAYEDGSVLAWNIEARVVERVMKGHDTIINAMTVSPDGSLCATAGRDKIVLLWDLKGQNNKCQISIDEPVHCLEFAFSAYLLAAGTDNGIIVWDILEKDIILEIPNPEESRGACTSICWADSFTLIAGYSDGSVRKYAFNVE